jgi:hypothetical protein
MLAVKHNFVHIFDLLLPFEYSIRNKHGRTALMLSAMKNNTEFIKKLMGYEMGLRDDIGKLALDYSFNTGRVLLQPE